MMHYGKLLALAGLVGIVSAEAGGSAYFYRRTMMRYNAKTERTMKMSGVDWEQYFSKINFHLILITHLWLIRGALFSLPE